MSLAGQISNQEIINFLRSATIKNSYFAERSKTIQVRPAVASTIPDNEIPYYRHMAGEYILKDAVNAVVKNPKTGDLELQTYTNTALFPDSRDKQTVEMDNRHVYTSGMEFDEMMYVISLDTGEEIPFTLRNLHAEYAEDASQVHTKTLEAYKLPSRYYELLVKRYPKQVDLIKAIVYPVKSARSLTESEKYDFEHSGQPYPDIHLRRKDYLVSAGNFEILNFDDTILAENERFNLVSEMRKLVDLIKTRWFVEGFNIEENYNSVLWAMMWSILVSGLVVQRYVNIKTPFAHDSHVWDYLTSKGLESYRGYLNLEQTLFLYKNIDYILRHRGQQRVTNILIDNLLNNVGLDIRSKTIVLDTTSVLDESDRVLTNNIASQCKTCTKREWCHKNITDRQCEDRQAIDNLCKPEPIVLTEEFAGASREKVISKLISQYGYSEKDAADIYKRAMLWPNDDVEAIKDALNRDQMTDLNGATESLDSLIQREYVSGLEPVYNEDVVALQRNDLRHIAGTYAPTKLLEITKKGADPRFTKLFGRFLTETLIHFCPRVYDGSTITKVRTAYSISAQRDDSEHIFNFSEMFAALYLGYCKEFDIEVIYDHIIPATETTYQEGKTYFAKENVAEPAANYKKYVNANRLKLMVPGVDYEVGDEIVKGILVYVWAPSSPDLPNFTPLVAGHEILTNLLGVMTYDFPIPSQAKFSTALRFGKPVKQSELVTLWENNRGDWAAYDSKFVWPSSVSHSDRATIKIGDIYYAVYQTTLTEKDEIWRQYGYKLVIVAVYKAGNTYVNRDEVPIIPTYFKWYNYHSTVTEGVGTIEYFPDGTLESIDGSDTGAETKIGHLNYDPDKQRYYQLLRTDDYMDVDKFIGKYMDLMEDVSEPEVIGQYLNNQFSLLEDIYVHADSSNSIKTQLAYKTFLDAVTMNGVNYEVDLTGTVKKTKWPAEGVSTYNAPQVTCATYSDWFKYVPELGAMFGTVDRSNDPKTIWNTFNTTCMKLLAAGCTLPYLSAAIDDTVLNKLRSLVRHLSSYKVQFIDVGEEEKSTAVFGNIVSDSDDTEINISKDIEYVMPILDAVWTPRVGFEINSETGEFYVYTEDTTVQEGKTYYEPITNHKLHSDTGVDQIDLDCDVMSYQAADTTVGNYIQPFSLFEKIDIYATLGIQDRSTVLEFKKDADGSWWFRVGTPVENTVETPASLADDEAGEDSWDNFLSVGYITEAVRKKCKARKYRKYVNVHDYDWSEFEKSDVVKQLLASRLVPHYIQTVDMSIDPAPVRELLGDTKFYGVEAPIEE